MSGAPACQASCFGAKSQGGLWPLPRPAERSLPAFVPRAKQLHIMRTPFVHLVSEESDPWPLIPRPEP